MRIDEIKHRIMNLKHSESCTVSLFANGKGKIIRNGFSFNLYLIQGESKVLPSLVDYYTEDGMEKLISTCFITGILKNEI